MSEAVIVKALTDCEGDASARLAQVQRVLQCGTQCGSCLPAVRALVEQCVPETVRAELVEASAPFDRLRANGVTA